MRRTLLLMICVLMISSVAMADHIGIYSDASGQSCALGNIAGQFSTSATVIHKFTLGATGSRFKVTFPAGTVFIGMVTPYAVVGVVPTDLSLSYGQCMSVCFVLGTFNAIYGAGMMQIAPADGLSNIIVTDCGLDEKLATGGVAYVSVPGDCPGPVLTSAADDHCGILANEPSTWGSVKALYR